MPPKRPLPRKRQTTINFSSTPKSAPKVIKRIELSDSEEDEISPDRPAKRRRFEEETERGMKLGMPTQRGGMFDSSDVDPDLLSSSTNSDGSASKTVRTSKSGNSKKKQKKRKKGKRKTKNESSSDEESEGVVEVVVPPKKTRSRRLRKEVTPEEESANEVQVVTRHKTHTKGKRRSPIPVDDSDEQKEEEEAPRRRTRHGRAIVRKSTPEEVSSENDQSGSEQGEDQGTPDGGGDSEEDELKEELAFLQSSPVADRGRLRSTGNKVKSSREMALEALKKRRADTNEPSSSAATPGRKKPVIHDSDSESGPDLQVIKEEDSDINDDEDENEEEDEIEDSDDNTTNAHDIFRSTNEDDDFIVDEDEGPLGAPAHDTQMPLEFTSMSTAKPRDLFKYAVEWSVHKKINPSFDSSDQIYELTFRKLDDEANGLANSKFHSTAWQSDFSRAIHARPEFIANEIGRGMKDVLEAHCEACNRKNHPASWEISLTGPAYLKETQEPVEEESDNSDDSNDDSDDSSSLSSTSSSGEKAIYNAVGERIPPESKTFTLGSTCKANAEVTHTLLHWRYHLHGWVVGYLEREGHFKPEQLVKREKWSDRKRFKRANKIVDRMEKDGEIRRLHRLYKQRIDFATEAKNEFSEGWGRRRG
ncbi:unnamed protein product [Periconia digitata]|uniref:DUF4211 domain-containing protein n=1 Tax=Periconia digitata TaxID=1303443 RepID=A0A9W4UVM4_9PLEO|nr:unnamed protein product [Periconia digitata]